MGRAASPPLTAENEVARCVCYYLCNAHCRQVQSLTDTQPPVRYIHAAPRDTDDSMYRASIASRDKSTPKSNLFAIAF